MSVLGRTCLLLFVCAALTQAQWKDLQRASRHQSDAAASDTARLEWVKHLNSSIASSVDVAADVAIDAGGFVYVTGKSESAESGGDYLTIKYTSLGQEVWRARYDGPANYDDAPVAIAVDEAGNVYVTGMSIGPSPCLYGVCENYDYATVKYNSLGQEQWVSRYSGPGNIMDIPIAIGIDPSGNIIVSGESDRIDSSQYGWYPNADIATIKYTPDGVQLWVARYNSPNNSNESSIDMTMDGLGNISILASRIVGTDNWGVFFGGIVLKYDSDGVEQWVREIKQDSTTVSVASMSMDGAGSVFVAGQWARKYQWNQFPSYIFAAKYNSSGQMEWIHSYDSSSGMNYRAHGLAVDTDGSVLIAGVGAVNPYWDFQGDRIVTMKYNGSGNLLWARQFRDRQLARVSVSDMDVDHSGNVIVTGSSGSLYSSVPFMGDSIVTLKYDGNGIPLWVEYYRGNAGVVKSEPSGMAIDAAGSIVIAGASKATPNNDFMTVKYHSSGVMQWDALATGEGSSFESLAAMTLDAAGNVYVTGSSIGAGTSSDYVTAKFDPNGNKLWSARFNSPDNGYDSPGAIAVDQSGNVQVTGSSRHGENFAYATVRYSPEGVELWTARYSFPPWYGGDPPRDMEVDRSGNSYVGNPARLIKYDGQGNQLWVSNDRVRAMTMDRHNALYFSTDSNLIRIDSLGVRQTFAQTTGHDIAVDDSGNVYVTRFGGWYPGLSERTQKFTPSGSLSWSLNRGGVQILLGHDGSIFVERYLDWSSDSAAFKISSSGTFEWAATFQDEWLGPLDFAVDGSGNLYLCGIHNPFYEDDVVAIKYGPSGVRQWSAVYSGLGSARETPYAMGVDANGSVYIAGTTENSNLTNTITLLKYSQVTVSVEEESQEVPLSFSLSQNYPNPFNPSTTIKFALPMSGHVELTIYNTLGQEVATLMNEEKFAGTYSAQWNAGSVASGVYFYRLMAGEFVQTRKLLLLK